MSEITESEEQYYTAKEAAELLGVTDSAFNNGIYRHALERETRNGRWYYPQSSIDKYRSILDGKAKQATPLQSNTEPAEQPPAALQSLDPLLSEEVEEEPEIIEASDMSEVQPLMPEVSPEIAMFNLVMSQLRRQVAKEQAAQFAVQLKDIRIGIVACNAMILASIDNAIAEYEASQDDTSSH